MITGLVGELKCSKSVSSKKVVEDLSKRLNLSSELVSKAEEYIDKYFELIRDRLSPMRVKIFAAAAIYYTLVNHSKTYLSIPDFVEEVYSSCGVMLSSRNVRKAVRGIAKVLGGKHKPSTSDTIKSVSRKLKLSDEEVKKLLPKYEDKTIVIYSITNVARDGRKKRALRRMFGMPYRSANQLITKVRFRLRERSNLKIILIKPTT